MAEELYSDSDRLLENIEVARQQVEETNADEIDVADLYLLSASIIELLDWSNTAYRTHGLGINPTLLNKFVKMRGRVRRLDAIKIADRLRTFVRSEMPTSMSQVANVGNLPLQEATPIHLTSKTPKIEAESWVLLPKTSEMKKKIQSISSLLDSIVQQVKHSNAPPTEQVLSDIEKAELVAILETALQVLRAPMVERGLIRSASLALGDIAKKTANEKLQEGLGHLMSTAGRILTEVINRST
jgi:hypothetical protein